MHLASLTLHGFKSFAERVTLEFSEGVTGIVGPNGSGKSNLLDALRWVSGGGRASEFRAGDKAELIFHGSAGARTLGYAEVALTLEPTGAGRSLHISRTLLRDGQSQLKLNGKNARFLDVEEALSGSGLGKSGPAVIGQGEVGQVLMADPERLLGYLEEAAGIARLSHRREATLSRLETARAHLERLEDLLLELGERCERLRGEAEEAEKATILQAESLRLRYTLARRRAEGLEREIRGLREQSGELQGALDGGRAELESAQQRWHEARQVLAEREQTYRQALAESESRRGDVRVAEERLTASQQRRETLCQERSRLQEEAQGLEASPPEAPEGDAEALAQAEEAARGALEVRQQALTTAEAELGELARRLEAARQAEAAYARAIAAFESRRGQLAEQLTDVKARLAALEDVEPPDETELEYLQNELKRARRALEDSREKLEAAQRQHAEAEAEAQARERTAVRSRAAVEARQGYAQGPKHALISGIAGVVGSVADLLRIPEAYQAAIGSALGRRAENVVVESAEVAQKVLAHVKQAGGWVTLLPLDLLAARKTSLPLGVADAPGVIGLASELVETDPRYDVLLTQLLGSTLLLASLEQAEALARRTRRRPRLVTLEGDILEPYGALTGGSRRVQSNVLGLAEEADEADDGARAARERAESLLEKLSESQRRYREQQEAVAGLEAQLRETRDTLQQALQQAAVQRSHRQGLEERRDGLQAHLARLSEPAEKPSADIEPLTIQVQQAQAELSEQRTHLTANAQHLAEVQRQRAVFEERWQRYQQALEFFQEGRRRVEVRQHRLEVNSHELEQAEAQLSLREQELKEAEAALPSGLEAIEAGFKEARDAGEAAEQGLTQLSQQQAERGAGLEELKLTLARRETAYEASQEEVKAFPDGLEPIEGSLRSLREHSSEVESLLADIGPVNHRAQQEYRVQRERLETLTAQGNEAGLAIAELQDVLHDIDREQAARLNIAVERLRHSFAEHVRQLFGPGSQADVEVERTEGRPVGLRLSLQPAGKQTRSLKLLSVGERSMGALAFLFALLQDEGEGGLPIAILDEVDAPLDEANIRRFRDFVRARAKLGTQFILITHQKATMEVADALWGVTSERGVSRVFSIRKSEEAAVGV